jgi:hypothetical protein
MIVDCRNFKGMFCLRQEAPRYLPRWPPTEGRVVLRDVARRGPNASLDHDAERGAGPDPVALDLHPDEPEHGTSPLLSLGATGYRPCEPDADLDALADREGRPSGAGPDHGGGTVDGVS